MSSNSKKNEQTLNITGTGENKIINAKEPLTSNSKKEDNSKNLKNMINTETP